MALTIVKTRAITGGVDTHADVHVAAAAGYVRLLGWLSGFGTVCLAG
jgi:hypothetical protein